MNLVDLQVSIYDALTAANLPVVGIYDNVLQVSDPSNNALFPFITVGDQSTREWGDDCYTGHDAEIRIHVWSRAHHTLEVKGILGDVRDVLNRGPLSVQDGSVLTVDHLNTQVLKDPDGVTLHGIAAFRALITDN